MNIERLHDSNRGRIRNRAKATQVIDLSGLGLPGRKTPTDLDAAIVLVDKYMLDYNGRAFVFVEYKTTGVDVLYGQRVALERLCDAVNATVPAVLVIADHDTPIGDDIDGANALVRMYYRGGLWRETKPGVNVRRICKQFIRQHGEHDGESTNRAAS